MHHPRLTHDPRYFTPDTSSLYILLPDTSPPDRLTPDTFLHVGGQDPIDTFITLRYFTRALAFVSPIAVAIVFAIGFVRVWRQSSSGLLVGRWVSIDMMSAETQACCRNVLDLQVFLYTYISLLICIYFLYVLSCVVQFRTQGWAQGRAQGRAGSGPKAARGRGLTYT